MKYVETANLQGLPSKAEQLSALHDGQLDAISAQALVRASLADDSIMQQWRSMSAISAVLSQGATAAQPALAVQAAQPLQVARPQEAANDGVFRWKMVAGIAALAAVGSIVWGLVGQAVPSGAQLAQQAPAQNVITVQANAGSGQETLVMIRDPRLDELLAAHKQFGGMSALQQPAGSLRSASLVSPRP